ncbi:MAG: PDZ domain-containing protein [Opitutales bacterium]|nr:PDZ domain-containing protein [Opitutales bacterium]
MKTFHQIILAFLYAFNLYGYTDNNNSELLIASERLNGSSIQHAFGSSKELATQATVRLLRNNKLIALGTIVHSSGYVLTKASSCVGAREAETSDGEKYLLKIKKRYEETDLALYKLITDKNSFQVINWDVDCNTTEGSWVLAAHNNLKEIRIGVTSGTPRKIGREGGVMGVLLTTDTSPVKGVKISEVVPQAAAYRAGLLEGDIITEIDNRRVKNQDSLIKIIGKKDPGDVVRVKVSRKTEIKKILVTLGHRSVTFDLFNRNLQMSGPVSKRKDNFEMIIQHDLPISKESMGGPLFNLDGKCIGINIARVDRVSTYALPAYLPSKVTSLFLEKLP